MIKIYSLFFNLQQTSIMVHCPSVNTGQDGQCMDIITLETLWFYRCLKLKSHDWLLTCSFFLLYLGFDYSCLCEWKKTIVKSNHAQCSSIIHNTKRGKITSYFWLYTNTTWMPNKVKNFNLLMFDPILALDFMFFFWMVLQSLTSTHWVLLTQAWMFPWSLVLKNWKPAAYWQGTSLWSEHGVL